MREDSCNYFPPHLAKTPDPVRPPYHYRRLSNGLEVLVLEYPHVPIVMIGFGVRGSSFVEDSQTIGYSTLVMNALLQSNAVYPTADVVDMRIQQLGIMWVDYFLRDASLRAMIMPATEYHAGMHLLSASLKTPKFEKKEIEHYAREAAGSIKDWLARPTLQLYRAALDRLYGKQSYKYITSLPEQIALMSDINEKLKEFFLNYYRPENAMLVIGGRVTAEDAFQTAEKFLGDWSPPPSSAGVFNCMPPPSVPHNLTFLKVLPSLSTIEYFQAYQGPGMISNWKEVFSLLIFKEYVKSSFSRLRHVMTHCGMEDLSVRYSPGRVGSPFVFRLQIQDSSVTEQAVQCLRQEIQRMDSPGYITLQAFLAAKKRVKISMQTTIDDWQAWVDNITRFWGASSLDYFLNFDRYVDSVSLADMRQTIRKYFKEGHWVGGLAVPVYYERLKHSSFIQDVKWIADYRWKIPPKTYTIPPRYEKDLDAIVFLMGINPHKKLVIRGEGPDVEVLLPLIREAVSRRGWEKRMRFPVVLISQPQRTSQNRIEFEMVDTE